MGRLKQTLGGSSMIETIVASMIFLLVFTISLSTVTGLTLREDEGYALIEAERRLADCSGRYCDGTWAQGEYTEEFDWGKITVTITDYGDYGQIRQVILRAALNNGRKKLEYRRLVLIKDE